MYALVIPKPPSSVDLQQTQPQPNSMGTKSSEYTEFRRFRVPADVIAFPNRWRSSHQSSIQSIVRQECSAYGSSCGPHTIKHVCSESDRHNKVFRISHSHDISWLALRQQIRASVNSNNRLSKLPSLSDGSTIHFAVLVLSLASRKPADGNTGGVPLDHFLAAFSSKVEI